MANRKCVCCGKEYKYCPNCSKDNAKPKWMVLYCSANCKSIFDIATKYSFHKLTKIEASEKLKQCDLSEIDLFTTNVKKNVLDIISEDIVAQANCIDKNSKNDIDNTDLIIASDLDKRTDDLLDTSREVFLKQYNKKKSKHGKK